MFSDVVRGMRVTPVIWVGQIDNVDFVESALLREDATWSVINALVNCEHGISMKYILTENALKLGQGR